MLIVLIDDYFKGEKLVMDVSLSKIRVGHTPTLTKNKIMLIKNTVISKEM